MAVIYNFMRKGLSAAEAGKLGGIASAKTASFRKQNRVDSWNNNPKFCKNCLAPILYKNRRNYFCNSSCATTFNNKGVRRHGEDKIEANCLFCEKLIFDSKYCSAKCQQNYIWKCRKEEIEKIGQNIILSTTTAKRFLIELNCGKCQICSLNEWQGKLMPLVLDHIDGNPYNDMLCNLRVICNNCDSLSATFKGKNKGSGRFKRAERYKYEKDMVGNIDGFKWKQ